MGREESEIITTADESNPEDTNAVVQPAPKKSGWGRELVETLLLTLIIFFGVRAVVQSFRVEGESMLPNLKPNELLLVNKAVYWHTDDDSPLRVIATDTSGGPQDRYIFHPPQRGDVIVFHAPPDTTKDYIKRVIGVPGDTVEIREGKVLVNGKELDESYLEGVFTEDNSFDLDARPPTWKVPPGKLFVLGDNRGGSSDSRQWGFVPYDFVVGKAMLAYWPVSEWGGVPGGALIIWWPWPLLSGILRA